MATSYSDVAYRTASASGATHIGLLLLVYDALASDFQKASGAVSRGDIAARCLYSNHALLLLGHLEEWCVLLNDESLATSLKSFYGHLRVNLLQYQTKGTPQDFSGLAIVVAETRAVWRLKEQQSAGKANLLSEVKDSMSGTSCDDDEVGCSSWSA